MDLCRIEKCGRPRWIARGLCSSHYRRFKTYGDPLAGPPIRNRAPDGLTMEEAVRSNTPAGLPTARCWVWQGNISSTGYGRATFGTQIISAHRAAWEVANGREVPSGMIVRHRCDNRPCVNPDHLEIGTQADNTRDMLWGRSPHPFNSKLTESDVVEIRARRDTGETYRSIAEDYPVTMFAIMSACTGRTWKHVP